MKKIAIFLILFTALLTVVQPSFAAEKEAEQGETAWQTVGKWFNFILLIGILYWFLGKTLRVQDQFKDDYDLIQKSIESAKLAKEEAEKRLQELEQRMVQVNEEVAKIKAAAAREAEEEKEKILESAQREALRIVEFAQREVESEVELARRQLQRQVADLALEQSKKIIEGEINDQDHKRLIKDYTESFRK